MRQLRSLARRALKKDGEALARKVAWVNAVDLFYAKIARWLAPLRREGVLAIRRKSCSLIEDDVGSYDIDRLYILIPGAPTIRLTPIGTDVSGACGRIDISIRHRTEMIVAIKPWRWSFAIAGADFKWKHDVVTSRSFQAMMVDLLNKPDQ